MSTGAGADATSSQASATGDEPAPRADALPRILCVDDEPVILAMLERALGSQYEVVTQSDPDAALALVQHGRFSVVISDMKMPGMTGEAFLEQVKRLAPQSTRLALTGGLDWQLPPDIAFGILTKPVTLPLLRATVGAAAQCHALHSSSELPPAAAPEPAHSSARPIALASSSHVESGLRPRQLEAGQEPSTPAAARSSPSAALRSSAPPAPNPRRLGLALLGAQVELWPRATLLGRGMDCDVVVRDERLSPRHLRFFSSWRGVTVQDVSGTGNVRLNGERLDAVRFIQPGDCIDLGPFEVRVDVLDP
ncbi:MAG TPA: response regulator [Polyangiaceae bacterium]|nr:response regulator [Polyangiaceae bacterium]